jgi:hypothetical protein
LAAFAWHGDIRVSHCHSKAPAALRDLFTANCAPLFAAFPNGANLKGLAEYPHVFKRALREAEIARGIRRSKDVRLHYKHLLQHCDCSNMPTFAGNSK